MAERSGGWWCCCQECTIFYDTFMYMTTDSPPGWIILDGNWLAGIGVLGEEGHPGAIILTSAQSPSEAMVVEVWTLNEQVTATYKIIVNYLDADNYHFALFEKDMSPGGVSKISLWARREGVNTLLTSETIIGIGEHPPNYDRVFTACFGANQFFAAVGTAVISSVWTETTAIPNGRRAGLSHDNTFPTYYYGFIMTKHVVDDPKCGSCVCACEGTQWPEAIHVDAILDGGSGPCACSSPPGQTTLHYDRVESAWLGTLTWGCGTWPLRIACSTTASSARLSTDITSSCCNDIDVPCTWTAEPDSTCQPFYLHFKHIIPSTWLAAPCCPGCLGPRPPATVHLYLTPEN